MSDAEVVVLPGVERRDLDEPVPDTDVLRWAIENGVTNVIIVGRERNGQLYVASANADADRIVGQLMRAVQYLTSHDLVQKEPA